MGFSSMGKVNKRNLLSTALVASLALGALGAVATPAAAADKTKAVKAGKVTYSKEFVAAATPLQAKAELIRLAKAKVDAKDPAGPADLTRCQLFIGADRSSFSSLHQRRNARAGGGQDRKSVV